MKASELQRALRDEFGDVYGGVLLRDHWLRELADTGAHALERGVAPKEVWNAMCEELGVPPERRYGRGMRDPQE